MNKIIFQYLEGNLILSSMSFIANNLKDFFFYFDRGKPVASGIMTRLLVRRLGTWFIATEWNAQNVARGDKVQEVSSLYLQKNTATLFCSIRLHLPNTKKH